MKFNKDLRDTIKDLWGITSPEKIFTETPFNGNPTKKVLKVVPMYLSKEVCLKLDKKRDRNRVVRETALTKFRESIQEYGYIATTDALMLDEDGYLVNFGHRLTELINQKLWNKLVYVVVNIPESMLDRIDEGKTRTYQDKKSVGKKGESLDTLYFTISSNCGYIDSKSAKTWGHRKAYLIVKDFVEEYYKELSEFIGFFKAFDREKQSGFSNRAFLVPMFKAYLSYPEETKEFITEVLTNSNDSYASELYQRLKGIHKTLPEIKGNGTTKPESITVYFGAWLLGSFDPYELSYTEVKELLYN
jgi:hypothetical protein